MSRDRADSSAGRDVFGDHRPGADNRAGADDDLWQHHAPRSDQRRPPDLDLTSEHGAGADRGIFGDGGMVPDAGGAIDDDIGTDPRPAPTVTPALTKLPAPISTDDARMAVGSTRGAARVMPKASASPLAIWRLSGVNSGHRKGVRSKTASSASGSIGGGPRSRKVAPGRLRTTAAMAPPNRRQVSSYLTAIGEPAPKRTISRLDTRIYRLIRRRASVAQCDDRVNSAWRVGPFACRAARR